MYAFRNYTHVVQEHFAKVLFSKECQVGIIHVSGKHDNQSKAYVCLPDKQDIDLCRNWQGICTAKIGLQKVE